MTKLFLIAFGGALGAPFRYFINDLMKNSSFFAHYDVLTQRPGYEQNIFTPSDYLFLEGNVGSFITNSNLKPQKTIDYEVGYKQKLTTRSAITVSTYYREMKNTNVKTKNTHIHICRE